MNAKQKIMLTWQCSLLASGLIAFFWTAWYLIAGSVPDSELFKIDGVPFKISRWWDIPAGAVIAALIVLMIINITAESDDNGNRSAPADELRFWLAFGMFVGILGLALFTLVFGLKSGLVPALALGLLWLVLCLAVGLVIGIIFGLLCLIVKAFLY